MRQRVCYANPHDARRAIEDAAGGPTRLIWVERMTQNIQNYLIPGETQYICLYAHERGRMHYMLHEVRSDGSAGALVLWAEG